MLLHLTKQVCKKCFPTKSTGGSRSPGGSYGAFETPQIRPCCIPFNLYSLGRQGERKGVRTSLGLGRRQEGVQSPTYFFKERTPFFFKAAPPFLIPCTIPDREFA